MADFYIKRGDRLPKFTVWLQNPDGSPVVLADEPIRFRMFPVGGKEAKVDGIGAIEDGPKGRVSYSWAAGDTDTPGEYNAEWAVMFGDDKEMTFPNYDYMKVLVYPDLK